jgi:chromosome segregation ATPase
MHGVWFGGRFWPGIGGAEDDPAAQGAALEASRAAARARVGELEAVAAAAAELRAQVDQLAANLASVQAEREAQREQAERASARAAELEAAHGEAVSRGLDARRRALIAENAGQVVEELVQGATDEPAGEIAHGLGVRG